MRGPISASFAIAPAPAKAHNAAATTGPNMIDAYAMVVDAFMPLFTRHSQGGGSLPSQGSALPLSREGSVEVSSLRRVDETYEVRTWNPSDEAAHLAIANRRGTIVNLVGDRIEGWAQSFDIGPHKIVTAQIDESTR